MSILEQKLKHIKHDGGKDMLQETVLLNLVHEQSNLHIIPYRGIKVCSARSRWL